MLSSEAKASKSEIHSLNTPLMLILITTIITTSKTRLMCHLGGPSASRMTPSITTLQDRAA